MKGFNYRNKLDAIPGAIFQLITRYPVLFGLNAIAGLDIEGVNKLNNVPTNDGIIFAANHTTELDGFLIPASIPIHRFHKTFHPVTREAAFYKDKGLRGNIYAHGLLFYCMGAFPAYAGKQNYKTSLWNQVNILEDDGVVLMFPEGKAQSKKTKAKGGTGYLAMHTQTPVIPLYANWSNVLERNACIRIGSPLSPPKPKNTSDTIETAKLFSEKILNTIYMLGNN